MRIICLLFLIAFATAIGIFAYQNNRLEIVDFYGQNRELSFPLLIGGMYLLGMFSGWTVVGMLKRSWRRVVEYDR